MQIKPRFITFAAVVLLAIFYVRIYSTAKVKSDTYDELKCLRAGEYLAQNLNWDIKSVIYHPPLSYLIHGYALKGGQFKDNDRKIFYARLVMAVFPLLLGFFIFRFARKEYGDIAGLAALFLYTFEPNIIAQSSLIQPDMFAATFLFIGFYFFRKSLRDIKNFKKIIFSGIAVGLSFLSKYNGVFIILIALLLEGNAIRLKKIKFRASFKHFILVSIIGLVVLNIGYNFTGSFKPLKDYTFESGFFDRLSKTPVLSSVPMPLPQGYLYGFDAQKHIAEAGHPTFLMGERSIKGWWHYFIVAFMIKTPIPLILLLVFALFYRPRRKGDVLIGAACLTLPFILMTNSNPGLRYLLPAFPFMFIYISDLVNIFLREENVYGNNKPKRILLDIKTLPKKTAFAGAVLISVWFAAESAAIHPHYLAYFNEFIGGPKNGWKYLADSNIDWGQDRFLVTKFLEKNPEVKLNPEEPAAGRFLINVNNIQDVFRINEQHRWLKKFSPAGNIGYSWLLYDIKADEYKNFVESAPDDAYANYLYGCVFNEDRYLLKALKLDPSLQEARAKLVQNYFSKAEYAAAARELRQAVTADSQDNAAAAAAYKDLAWIAEKTGDKQLTAFYTKRYRIAKVLSSYPFKISLDENQYKKNISIDPSDSKSWNNLGFIYWMRDDNKKAAECFKKAYELKPYLLDYLVNLLELSEESGLNKTVEFNKLISDYQSKVNLASTARVSQLQYGDNKMILEDTLLIQR